MSSFWPSSVSRGLPMAATRTAAPAPEAAPPAAVDAGLLEQANWLSGQMLGVLGSKMKWRPLAPDPAEPEPLPGLRSVQGAAGGHGRLSRPTRQPGRAGGPRLCRMAAWARWKSLSPALRGRRHGGFSRAAARPSGPRKRGGQGRGGEGGHNGLPIHHGSDGLVR